MGEPRRHTSRPEGSSRASQGLWTVDPIRDALGWAFRNAPGTTGDPINGWKYSGAYELSQPGYSKRVSAVLWDSQRRRIVNNESSETSYRSTTRSTRGLITRTSI